MKLGMETVLRVAEARERLRLQAAESGIRTPTFEDFEDGEVEVLIREIFNLGSRPTSPHPATSTSNGTNGAVNSTIKLGPAPSGNLPKANGASASRANGTGAGASASNHASNGIHGSTNGNSKTTNTNTSGSGSGGTTSATSPLFGQTKGSQRDGAPGTK